MHEWCHNGDMQRLQNRRMTESREPILLLSGAGLPVWIWDQVREELAASHETVVAERPRHDRPSLTEYAAAALDSAPWERFDGRRALQWRDCRNGIVTLAPDRVGAFLAVTAVVPKPGTQLRRVDAVAEPARAEPGDATGRHPTARCRHPARRGQPRRYEDGRSHRGGVPPRVARLYWDTPRGGRFPERRGYLSTSQDAELPIGLQRRFARNLDTSWNESLDSGHLPMLEAPHALARRIANFLTN